MTAPESHIRQLLLDCLSRAVPEIDPARMKNLTPEDWRELLDLARSQRVLCLLWGRITDKGLADDVPSAVRETMQAALRRNTMRNLRYYGELRRLCDALQAEGIPLILLKGIHLAAGVYGNMGLREMGDIDVLARTNDLDHVADVLIGLGYTPEKTYRAETTIQAIHHMPALIKPGHACFEIHWNLAEPGKSYSIDPGGLWERACPIQVAGCAALALSPEDTLLHLCMHAAYQHQFAFGLRPSCDIAELIAHHGPDLNWDAVLQRAVEYGWLRGVRLALIMAEKLVGAEVPHQLLCGPYAEDAGNDILEILREQIFTNIATAHSVHLPVAALLTEQGFRTRFRVFWERVFVSRKLMAAYYSIPADSWKILACYPRRVVDLLRKHSGVLARYHQTDGEFQSIVQRRRRIARLLDLE